MGETFKYIIIKNFAGHNICEAAILHTNLLIYTFSFAAGIGPNVAVIRQYNAHASILLKEKFQRGRKNTSLF